MPGAPVRCERCRLLPVDRTSASRPDSGGQRPTYSGGKPRTRRGSDRRNPPRRPAPSAIVTAVMTSGRIGWPCSVGCGAPGARGRRPSAARKGGASAHGAPRSRGALKPYRKFSRGRRQSGRSVKKAVGHASMTIYGNDSLNAMRNALERLGRMSNGDPPEALLGRCCCQLLLSGPVDHDRPAAFGLLR